MVGKHRRSRTKRLQLRHLPVLPISLSESREMFVVVKLSPHSQNEDRGAGLLVTEIFFKSASASRTGCAAKKYLYQ